MKLLYFVAGIGITFIPSLVKWLLFSKKREPTKDYYELDLKEHKQQSTFASFFATNEDIYKMLYQKLQSLPDDKPIRINIETFGGSALWTEMICRIIKSKQNTVSVYIKTYGLSAGSCIALAADELYMTPTAALSAIDPQESIFRHIYLPVKEIAKLIEDFRKNTIDIYNKRSENGLDKTYSLINDKYSPEEKKRIVERMYSEPVDHATLFFIEDLEQIGIRINLLTN